MRRTRGGGPSSRGAARRHDAGIPAGRPQLRAASALVAALAALAFVVFGGCGTGSGDTVSKVVVLGIDGLDWQLIDPLIEQGRLPNIAALIERGVRADFRSLEPEMKSPMIWTTIATGKGPQKHGIADFLQGTDAQPLYNSNGWLARPVWDILSERGYSVGVINWMVTWPAKRVNGYNVTDRIVYRPEDGSGEVRRVAYPEGLGEELAPYTRSVTSVSVDDVAPFLVGDAWRTSTESDLVSAIEALRLLYAHDETALGVAKHLLSSREQPDFFAVYLNGVDVSCHSFWGAMDPSSVDIRMSTDLVSACSEVVPRYYERMDGIVGELLDAVDDDSTVILCSDHGFRGPYRSPQGTKLGIWMHRPVGVFVAAGPGVNLDAQLEDASVFDVTPTVLALMGEPVAYDMDGFVLEELISSERLAEAPLRRTETYEASSFASRDDEDDAPAESAVDDEIRERLRSLGYIE